MKSVLPSGLPWAEGTGRDVQNRKHNGKEFIEMHDYDTYDYVARGMYPAIMSFTSVVHMLIIITTLVHMYIVEEIP